MGAILVAVLGDSLQSESARFRHSVHKVGVVAVGVVDMVVVGWVAIMGRSLLPRAVDPGASHQASLVTDPTTKEWN